ncbi:MAG: hypothetical protein ACLGIK_14585 [Gemmatimonadota bacterium]
MKKIILAAVVVVASMATTGAGLAQSANPLVGSWNISYERGRRMENGEVTPIMGTATLSIAEQGDSLVATIQPAARPDGTKPPAATFGGKVTPAGAVFVQEQMATLNENGVESQRKMTLTWSLNAAGDALTGTLARELSGMEGAPPAPVKGTRVAH